MATSATIDVAKRIEELRSVLSFLFGTAGAELRADFERLTRVWKLRGPLDTPTDADYAAATRDNHDATSEGDAIRIRRRYQCVLAKRTALRHSARMLRRMVSYSRDDRTRAEVEAIADDQDDKVDEHSWSCVLQACTESFNAFYHCWCEADRILNGLPCDLFDDHNAPPADRWTARTKAWLNSHRRPWAFAWTNVDAANLKQLVAMASEEATINKRALPDNWPDIDTWEKVDQKLSQAQFWIAGQRIGSPENDYGREVQAKLVVVSEQLKAAQGDDEAEATKPTQGDDEAEAPGKRATVNDRMAGTIMKNTEAMGWNSRQWAEHLKCGKPAVVETATWKKLESARLQAKAERMKDRQRKPKASDRRRD